MLHEVLLALSGHPSPLFSDHAQPSADSFPLLSPSEAALLQSIGKLAERHRTLRHHVQWLATNHVSIICRATATSIQQSHLARFQRKIIEVERRILTKDASIVGAYDIVPLASVVGEFDDWRRLMGWFCDIAYFMQQAPNPSSHTGCTGPALIDELRAAANTGFPEIAAAATDLSKVAETAWLRQLSSWLLYGKLPAFGAQDFFIKPDQAVNGEAETFRKDRNLQPGFVTPATASSVLFVGKSCHQVQQLSQKSKAAPGLSSRAPTQAQLAQTHLQYLSALPLPIQPAQLSRAVSAIRLSLSQNVLQHLLPMHVTINLLSCLRQYMLLGRGEFALAMISQAENRLEARQLSMGRLLQQGPLRGLEGLSIKDAELHQLLSQIWKTLTRDDESGEDSVLEFATKHITLSTSTKGDSRPTTSHSVNGQVPQISPIAFNDLLLPTPTSLSLVIESPLDLFVTAKESEAYSAINAYLVAIRRAQVRLSNLWRRSFARREGPASFVREAGQVSEAARKRNRQRAQETRKVWATCSAAIFLISETAAFFEGECIKESCDDFEAWVKTPMEAPVDVQTSSDGGNASIAAQRDPETLAAGHRTFLAALTYALLLTDIHYTRELRSLLGHLDALIAYFNRLLDLQQKLDLELDTGEASSLTDADEQRVSLELDRARKLADSGLKSVINRLRQLDHERIGAARYLDVGVVESGGYTPWKGGGVDRLLMKLDFGTGGKDGYEAIV